MAKRCGKCTKTVYPAEEMKCLDQVWHKACFKCAECGMTLNLKNYVGFNKIPYCSAHNPSKKLTATVVAETPEQHRVSQLSKLTSGVEYKKDYEKSKGTVISVADDPSTQHARQAAHNASGYSYTQAARSSQGPPNNNYDEDFESAHEDIPQPAPVQLPYANRAQPPTARSLPPAPSAPLYRAMYDYDAQEGEEVSFAEGDIIEDFQLIEEGWGNGTVQRTGERGMIPSNYIELCE